MMNTHEKLNIINDMLEAQLDYINSMVPKEEFRNVDNTPKHLLHMTEEDLKPKTAQELRDDWNELVKEARSKIKPVLMSIEDREKFIRPRENLQKDLDDKSDPNRALVGFDKMSDVFLDSEEINLEILRKIQDKKMEIDLEYERTRDLYEKQRVVDQYLEEH